MAGSNTKNGKRRDSAGRVLREGEYQRPNGTYEWRYKGRDNRRHAIYAPTLDELREKEAGINHDLALRIDPTSAGQTFQEVYDAWVELRRGDVETGQLEERTLSNYCYVYELWGRERFGQVLVGDFTRSGLRRDFVELMRGSKGRKPLSPHSVECLRTVVFQVLQTVVDDHGLMTNPAAGSLPAAAKRKPKNPGKTYLDKSLTVVQMGEVLGFADVRAWYRRWVPMVEFLLSTGLRIGEMCALQWSDCDFKAGLIHVTKSLSHYQRTGYDEQGRLARREMVRTIKSPKTESSIRDVPMLPMAREALLAQRRYCRELGLRCKTPIDGYSDFVFLTLEGTPLTGMRVAKKFSLLVEQHNKVLRERAAKEGVPVDEKRLIPKGFSPHWCRHTFCTRLVEANVPPEVVKRVMGHASLSVTLGVYTSAQAEYVSREMHAYVQRMAGVVPEAFPTWEEDMRRLGDGYAAAHRLYADSTPVYALPKGDEERLTTELTQEVSLGEARRRARASMSSVRGRVKQAKDGER